MRTRTLAILSATILLSCTKEIIGPDSTVPNGDIITINAKTTSEPDVKTVVGENMRSVKWEDTDQLSVVVMKADNTFSKNAVFSRAGGENTFQGKFAEGDGPSASGKNTYYALYPHDSEIQGIKYFEKEKKTHFYTSNGKVYSIAIEPGTQTGINNMDHLHLPFFGKAVVDGLSNITMTMNHVVAITKVTFVNNGTEPLEVSEVKLSVDGNDKLSGKFRVNPDGDYALLGSKSGGKSYAALAVNGATVPAGTSADFYVMSARLKIDGKSTSTKLTVTVTTNKGTSVSEKIVSDKVNSPLILREGLVHSTKVKYLDIADETTVNPEIFTLLNLDYPGLETVKEYYSQQKMSLAAEALLQYYRGRSNIINPNVDLSNRRLTQAARNIADQALEYRFYVRNYKEGVQNGQDLYWSFKAADGSINWKFNPPGADKEFGIQKHRHQWMISQAKAFHCTGEEKYVQSILDVYADWLKAYPYKEGKIDYTEGDHGTEDEIDYGRAWSGLQPTERLLQQLDILYYILPSNTLTPDLFADFLIMMSKTADKIQASPVVEANSNIRLAQDQALASIAMLMPEFAHADQWMTHGVREITRHLNNQFNRDGVQNELDPGYHFSVIGDFLRVYNIAKVNNRLGSFPDYYVPTLKNACNFAADIIWPDYTVDFFNDTRLWSSSVLLRNMRTYASIFPEDEELAWMASEGQTPEPKSRVKLYDQSGWYMMMNGWSKSDMKLIHKNNYNPANKWHCQFDNGTISVYKNGRCFTPDPGSYSYGGDATSNADRKAFASASIHNTVTKDGQDIQKNHGKGKLLKSESTQTYELIVTENPSYDDFTHRRAIYMVENKFYVIVDEAFGPASNVNAILNFSLCTDEQNKNIHVVQTDDFSKNFIYGVHTEFGDGNNMLFRTFTDCKTGYSAKTNTAYYSPNIGIKIQRKRYTVSVRKEAGQEARFITVIMPFSNLDEIRNMNISASFKSAPSNTPSGAEVEIVVDNKTYILKYSL